MNESNTKALLRDFPRLFRGKSKPITESLMAFGFDCGDGWFALIYKLSADIEKVSKESGLDVNSEQWPEVTQVKEKLGTLRFYLNTSATVTWQKIYDLIEAAEERSATICEWCGEQGTRRPNGWIRTLCDTCEHRYQQSRK